MAEEGNVFCEPLQEQAVHVLLLRKLEELHSWRGWEASAVSDSQRAAALKILLHYALATKRSGDFFFSTPEYAALRLAAANMDDTLVRRPAHRQRALLACYDSDLALFSKSWVLQMPMDDRLRTSSLGDLSLQELMGLRTCLKAGWAEEFHVSTVGASTNDPAIWVTPHRRL